MTDPDDLALKRALDALPRSIDPDEDLWPAIRARLPRGARRRWHRPGALEPRTLRIAAGLAIIGLGLSALALITRSEARWQVAVQTGAPRLDGRPAGATERFRAGAVLTTDASAEARLDVGSIGTVTVDRSTEVRLIAARADEHRLELRRGFIHARINAPPRLFIVETPAGTAVDLGCAYTLHVDSSGASVLHVTAGWVEFGGGGRLALVPAGFVVTAGTGSGVALPLREQASAELARAAVVLAAVPASDSAVAALVRSAGRADAVTLWHALDLVAPEHRAILYDRLAELAPPPEGVTRSGILAGNRLMMRLWWERLPGTLPITPDWVKRVWMGWLRVASWL